MASANQKLRRSSLSRLKSWIKKLRRLVRASALFCRMNKARSNFNDVGLDGRLALSCLLLWFCTELWAYSHENLSERGTHLFIMLMQHRWKNWSFSKTFFDEHPRAQHIRNGVVLWWIILGPYWDEYSGRHLFSKSPPETKYPGCFVAGEDVRPQACLQASWRWTY